MLRRALLTTCLVAGLVAASAGTADAATVSPSKWAPKFCTALETWSNTIAEEGSSLQTTLSGQTGNLTAARDELVSFLGKSVAATQTAVTAMKKAGTPSSANGDKIAGKFVTGLQAVQKEFVKAKAKAAAISTTDATAFATTGKEIQQDLDNADSTVSASFNGIGKLDKGKKLETAIKAAPACSFLG
jgi:hypothetical protein